MTKIIGSPGKYIQGKGELNRLYSHIFPISKNRYLLLVDSFVNKQYASIFTSSLEENEIDFQVEVFGG